MHFGHESRAITMLFLNEIIPFAIPYHSSPIPMSMQCICKMKNFVEIRVFILKILTKNAFCT